MPSVTTSIRSENIQAKQTPATDSNSILNLNPSKADLPGRVSFSKNDVYEIDYSDLENEIDTSRSLEQTEHFRKKNVRFEDEFFNHLCPDDGVENSLKMIEQSEAFTFGATSKDDGINNPDSDKMIESSDEPSTAPYPLPQAEKYCCSLKCNSLCQKDSNTLPKYDPDPIDHSERIIAEYKREIENINRRHELELKWSGNTLHETPELLPNYFNSKSNGVKSGNVERPLKTASIKTQTVDAKPTNTPPGSAKAPNFVEIEQRASTSKLSWNPDNMEKRLSISSGKTESDDSITRGSSSTVIDNYLKVANQKSTTKLTGPIKAKPLKKSIPLSATLTATSTVNTGRKIKSAQLTNLRTPLNQRMSKAKSVSSLQSSESKLDEFHLDRVESWMSTHEDTFSDTGLTPYRKVKLGSTGNLSYKKAWRETPTSKTDDEGNFSLDDQIDCNSYDDSTFGEIRNVKNRIQELKGSETFGRSTQISAS